MATNNGIPVNFGYTGTKTADGTQGISITGITDTLLQSAEQTKVAEVERVRDGNGNQVVHVWSDEHDEATLEWVVTGSGLAAAITNTGAALKSPGAFIAITTCASHPGLVGTCWEVQSGTKVSGSNTTAKKVTMPIHLLPGITGVAS
jgi:hypothetical protein